MFMIKTTNMNLNETGFSTYSARVFRHAFSSRAAFVLPWSLRERSLNVLINDQLRITRPSTEFVGADEAK